MLNGWKDFDDTLRALDLFQRRIDGAFFDGWQERERPRARVPAAWPAVNLFETKEAFVYKVEVPGIAESDVAVYVEDEALVVRGERKTRVPEGYQVHLRERTPAAFTRKLGLPGRVDSAAVTATMKDGILTVTLPKSKEALPRQIAVKAG